MSDHYTMQNPWYSLTDYLSLDIIVVLALLIMLSAAIYMILTFYICDDQTCKAFVIANNEEERGTVAYNIELLNNIFIDGVWPIALIGSLIASFFSMWLGGGNMTIANYFIMFFINFLVIYFTFNFSIHHYLQPILAYVKENYLPNGPNGPNDPTNPNGSNGKNPDNSEISIVTEEQCSYEINRYQETDDEVIENYNTSEPVVFSQSSRLRSEPVSFSRADSHRKSSNKSR